MTDQQQIRFVSDFVFYTFVFLNPSSSFEDFSLKGRCHLFLVSLWIANKRICFNGIVKIMFEFC